ncbi:MAG: hypothetical protein ACT4QF_10265 [Sporichthyaceae bacterium]
MAKKPQDPTEPSRRETSERIAAAVKQEDRKALRDKLIFVGLPVVLVIVAGAIFFAKREGDPKLPGQGDKTYEALSKVGPNPQIAGCGKPTDDAVPPNIPPATPGRKVDYVTVPPSFGPSLPEPVAVNETGYYTAADRPPVEGLVANLKAGWSVLWYDGTALGPNQKRLIQEAAAILRKDPRYSKFVAVEWDVKYGRLPENGPIALTRWVTGENELAHRVYCNEASGELFRAWMAIWGDGVIPGIDDVSA